LVAVAENWGRIPLGSPSRVLYACLGPVPRGILSVMAGTATGNRAQVCSAYWLLGCGCRRVCFISFPRCVRAHRFGNANVSGQWCSFQLEASWKRSARPQTFLFPIQVDMETQAFICKAAVSKSRRVGTERFARGHSCFKLKSSWKRNVLLGKLVLG
jgi:hypothetical protein